MKVHRYGDGALYFDLELEADDPAAPARVRDVASALRLRFPLAEVVAGAESVAVVFAGEQERALAGDARDETIDLATIGAEVAAQVHAPADANGEGGASGVEHRISVVYDGPDLDEVAHAAGLAVDDVVRLHAARAYQVELIGFLPGFAYLGPLEPRLVVPRRASPRPRIAAGSVGVAGRYTGVYPLASPGGWQLIGRVIDVNLFDPHRAPPALLQPGDRVRFVPAHG